MRSTLPKVLHRVGGRTLLEAVLDAAEGLSPAQVVVVLGAGRERVEASLGGAVRSPSSSRIRRSEPETRCAGRCRALEDGDGPVLVLSGDTPLLRPETLSALLERRREGGARSRAALLPPSRAGDFGRVVRDGRGRVRRIVEAKNASARERRIAEVNAGVYCFAAAALRRARPEADRATRSPASTT